MARIIWKHCQRKEENRRDRDRDREKAVTLRAPPQQQQHQTLISQKKIKEIPLMPQWSGLRVVM